jgi:hypothetical protein
VAVGADRPRALSAGGPAEVTVDDQGLSAVELRRTLENWPADKKVPKVL